MKTTPNYFPSMNPSDGSLKIEVYLTAQRAKFKRVNDTTIFVPEYGDDTRTVSIFLTHSADDLLAVNVEGEIEADAKNIDEVLRLVNLMNVRSNLGHFYMCSNCYGLHFKYVQKMVVADLSDAVIKEAMDTASFTFLHHEYPMHLIVDHGMAAKAAFEALQSSEDDDLASNGGAE